VCASNQYESAPLTITADRQCTTTTVCTAAQFQATAPTATTDRVCQAVSPACTKNQARAYFVHSEKQTFAQAEQKCVNAQQHLASFGSQADLNSMVATAGYDKKVNYWVGLNDRDSEGAYKYTDGTTGGKCPGCARGCVRASAVCCHSPARCCHGAQPSRPGRAASPTAAATRTAQ
jgi:hypothetical protein